MAEKKTEKKDKGSVGITNTQNRLEIMWGGELKIESEPEKGTKAVIVIPE